MAKVNGYIKNTIITTAGVCVKKPNWKANPAKYVEIAVIIA